MFITRATRHDRDDIKELLDGHGWHDVDLTEGTSFIAREGAVVGCVRVIEVAPQTLVIDDVLVRADKRGQGYARGLMQAAMNSRGGTIYLCCHDPHVSLYEKFGFAEVPEGTLPPPVVEYLTKVGDYPSTPEHVHRFMKAR